MSKAKIKAESERPLAELTNDECDFIIHGLTLLVRDRVSEGEFYQLFGRGLQIGAADADKDFVRGLVRRFARPA